MCLELFLSNLKLPKLPQFIKNGDPLDCTNYRPISLLSYLRKLIEKLIHSRLNIFIENDKCFHKNQFGFRKKHSTNHALTTITFFKIRVLWYLGYPTWPYQIWPNQQKTLYTHKWYWFKHFKQHTWHTTRLSSWTTLIPDINKWYE